MAVGCLSVAEARGFIRVERQADGKWSFVDPDGKPFVGLGIDHVRYEGFSCEKTGEAKHLAYNLRRYGTYDAWETNTFRRLRDWGFTMLGASPTNILHKGFPHITIPQMGNLFARRGGAYALANGPSEPGMRFPNVDHPEWESYCRWFARESFVRTRDDRDLVGYFIDNELKWHALDGLSDAEVRRRAERYFRTTTEAIRSVDPNHLILGCRFAGFHSASPIVWQVAAKYCDVISVNCYPWVDLDRDILYLKRGEPKTIVDGFTEVHRLTGKPIFVSEWGFSALDGPCPCTHGGGQRFRTQAQRTRATLLTARTFLSLPFVVGYDFFMWVDEPREGIRIDSPEDCAYGLLPEEGEPYPLAAKLGAIQRDLKKWRTAPPPASHDPVEPFSETADEYLKRTGFAGSGAGLTWNGEYYRLSNGKGFELDGVLGSTDIFERAWWKGAKLGSLGFMLNFVANGRLTWIPVDRVLSAETERTKGVTRVLIKGRGGRNGILFTATLACTVYPDRPWLMVELVDVENTGPVPVEVKSYFFTVQAPFAKEGNYKKRVRHLWDVANADAWRADDGRVWGASSYARNLQVLHFWVDDEGHPHADAAVLAGEKPLALPPGGKVKPSPGSVWMCIHGGVR